eukprot:CAMPEP_0194357694 /NCGR_PEP_ID=MMETSP0174-20130528/5142_1 /TAXON_ID=216777 /ORGANISM="Proboscia alata, Strain PI-D3" /LENGTH=59 /DNA_ID=CAMNT_0039127819 /DNA_START=1697 /DNA_END=1872 /DNA_ORIENTATION=+
MVDASCAPSRFSNCTTRLEGRSEDGSTSSWEDLKRLEVSRYPSLLSGLLIPTRDPAQAT